MYTPCVASVQSRYDSHSSKSVRSETLFQVNQQRIDEIYIVATEKFD